MDLLELKSASTLHQAHQAIVNFY